MPWDLSNYPPAMQHLGEAARLRAMAIANSLRAAGLDEGTAIRIAIAQAKRWAAARGLPTRDDG